MTPAPYLVFAMRGALAFSCISPNDTFASLGLKPRMAIAIGYQISHPTKVKILYASPRFSPPMKLGNERRGIIKSCVFVLKIGCQ